MKKIISLLVFICVVISSCKSLHFTQDELAWFDVYNKKDMLIFQSLRTQQKDTTFIIKKRRNNYYPLLARKKSDYFYERAYMIYSNKQLKLRSGYDTGYIFSQYKTAPDKHVQPTLEYLHSKFLYNDTLQKRQTQLTITGSTFTNAYRLTDYYSRDNEPEVLYWDTQYGIIKYITHDGEMWERINW